jgi:hypothetical protein
VASIFYLLLDRFLLLLLLLPAAFGPRAQWSGGEWQRGEAARFFAFLYFTG